MTHKLIFVNQPGNCFSFVCNMDLELSQRQMFGYQELAEILILINDLSNEITSKCLASVSAKTDKKDLPCKIQETSVQALEALLKLSQSLDNCFNKEMTETTTHATSNICSSSVDLGCLHLDLKKKITTSCKKDKFTNFTNLAGYNKSQSIAKQSKYHNNSSQIEKCTLATRYNASRRLNGNAICLHSLCCKQFIEGFSTRTIFSKTYSHHLNENLIFVQPSVTTTTPKQKALTAASSDAELCRTASSSLVCQNSEPSVLVEPKRLSENAHQKRYYLYYHYEFDLLSSSDKDSSLKILLRRCCEQENAYKTELALQFCLPYLTLLEQITKIAALSLSFYHVIMKEIQIMDLGQDKEVVWLPAFTRRILPNVSRTLRWLRVDCTEHVLFASSLGPSLEKLVLCNVPAATTSRSSLLTIQLKEATQAAYKTLNYSETNDQKEDESVRCDELNNSAEVLQTLHPLSGWLYSLIKRCRYLNALYIEFFPEFPFVISTNCAPNCSVSSEASQTHAIGNPFFTVGSRKSVWATNSQISALFFKNHLPSAKATNNLCFENLTILALHRIVSSMPLTLLLGISFPKLKSLKLSTTVGFSTSNLVEFLKLFACIKSSTKSSTPLHSLIIHHDSNIADSRLLESIGVWSELQVLQLTSDVSYGSNVMLSHPTLAQVIISVSRQLSWKLRLPKLKHLILLVLCDYTIKNCLSFMKLSELLSSALECSPYLETFDVFDSMYQTRLLSLSSRKAILKEASVATS